MFSNLFLNFKNEETVAYDNSEKKTDSVFSKRVKAGKRRTYFFDIRETKGSDFYLTITESRKRFDAEGYDRHKIFVYKEDFNKFLKGLTDAVDHVKTELMPDFDFDAFSHEDDYYNNESAAGIIEEGSENSGMEEPLSENKTTEKTPEEGVTSNPLPLDNGSHEVVDKW